MSSTYLDIKRYIEKKGTKRTVEGDKEISIYTWDTEDTDKYRVRGIQGNFNINRGIQGDLIKEKKYITYDLNENVRRSSLQKFE